MSVGPAEAPATGYADLAAALPQDPERFAAASDFLRVLAVYMTQGQYMIAGDLAMRHQIFHSDVDVNLDVNGPEPVDVRVSGIDTLNAMLMEDFVVAHFHGDQDDFFMMLVHPDTGQTAIVTPMAVHLGADVTQLWDSREPYDEPVEIPIMTKDAMLANIVWGLQRVFDDLPVDCRSFSDAQILFALTDEELVMAENLWQDLVAAEAAAYRQRDEEPPERLTLLHTFLRARNKVLQKQHANLLTLPPSHFGRPAGTDCEHCRQSNPGEFPPTDTPQQVYEIWEAA